jgi:hypothetical protein
MKRASTQPAMGTAGAALDVLGETAGAPPAAVAAPGPGGAVRNTSNQSSSFGKFTVAFATVPPGPSWGAGLALRSSTATVSLRPN